MNKLSLKNIYKRMRARIRRSLDLYRTPLVTFGVMGLAIFVGIVFYAQYGLLFIKPSNEVLSSNTNQTFKSTSNSPKPTSSPAPEAIVQAPPAVKQPVKPKEFSTDRRPNTCNEVMKDQAEQTRRKKLIEADEQHQKNINSIGTITRLLSSIRIGDAKQQHRKEMQRFESVKADIEERHYQQLVRANCAT